MNTKITSAEVKANVDVRPSRSQVFLVALAVISMIAIVCAATLLAIGNPTGYAFLGFAVIPIGAGLWGWKKSQSDVDLDESHPTQICLPDGTKVTTDSRTLRSFEGVDGFARVLQEVLCRKPLPDPDGLLDAAAKVIPDSRDAATEIARQINNKTQQMTNALIDAFGIDDINATDTTVQALDAESILAPDVVPQVNQNQLIGGPKVKLNGAGE